MGLVQVSNGHCNTWDHVTRVFPNLSDRNAMSTFDSLSAVTEGGKCPSEEHVLLRVALE